MESWEIPYTVGDDEAIERIKNALSRYIQVIGESENALTVIPKPVPSASITVKDGKITVTGFILGETTAHACKSLLSAEFS